jgi:simple sugar transport system substrate-binding protein/ribose transport system substrate-binding protein
MSKRRLSLIAAAVSALLLLAACGDSGNGEQSTGGGSSGKPKQVKIASLLQPADNPWVQNNIKFQKQVAAALGIDLTITSDQGTDESNVAAMRGLIAQQPDGILFDPISEAAGKQDAQLLEQYKVPGATQDRLVVPNISDYQGQYLIAQATQSNQTWGQSTMKTLIDAGAKNIVTILPPHGILTVEQFWVGAKKALAENPDVKLVQESWVKQSRETAIQTMQQYLTKYPSGQIDGVVAIGSTMGLGAQYATEQAGRAGEIKVATADDDPDVIKAIKSGDLAATFGTHWTNGGWGLIVLYDHLQGHQPKSRQPEFNLFNINKSNADAYSKRFLEGEPLTADEIRSLSLTYNSNADLPTFVQNFHETWDDAKRGLP